MQSFINDFLQVASKMIALLVSTAELFYLKKVITKDDRNYANECDLIMLSNRKTVHILMICLGLYF